MPKLIAICTLINLHLVPVFLEFQKHCLHLLHAIISIYFIWLRCLSFFPSQRQKWISQTLSLLINLGNCWMLKNGCRMNCWCSFAILTSGIFNQFLSSTSILQLVMIIPKYIEEPKLSCFVYTSSSVANSRDVNSQLMIFKENVLNNHWGNYIIFLMSLLLLSHWLPFVKLTDRCLKSLTCLKRNHLKVWATPFRKM